MNLNLKISMLLSSLGLALMSISSKFLGVFRDILVAACLGAGPAGGAWAVANLAPNMFRRIFGEGAVGTSMVPMLTDSIDRDGDREYAALQLRTIMLAVAGILLVIVALGIFVPLLYKIIFLTGDSPSLKAQLAVHAIPAAMPYAFFICLVGVATAALNAVKEFTWPSAVGLLFNVFTIAFLFFYQSSGLQWSEKKLLVVLCLSVSFSGVAQLVCIICLLKRHQLWSPNVIKSLPWRATLTQLWQLSFPALIGAGALQISLMIDWGLALSVSEYAAGALMYAEHIGFLPVSVVAVTLGVVGLSHMSTAAARGDLDELKSIFNFGLRYTLFLSVPMAIFTGFYAEEIVRVIFQRGRFDDESVLQTVWALKYLAWGVPAFCSSKIVVSSFQSRKDMVTPVKVSVLTTFINVIIALVLMWELKQAGLAIAIGCGAMLNNLILLYLLRQDIGAFGGRRIVFATIKSLIASIISIYACWCVWDYLPRSGYFKRISDCWLPLVVVLILFCSIYAIMSIVLKSEELTPLAKWVKNKVKKSKT